ncbi:anaphase-promoting complex subunit CDC26 [Elysia marginata]|uniref:Anaphase-promoting complex subunit CDC26 n=1 Tax=Elysia marginata TaxID=1093978 RepID=A0AAV4FKB5_9GAST|nr:anaphase-promoting complex subunit CDC26 [Elysia marginata]
MLRRKPTRIELKISDLEEYEAVKKEKEAAKNAATKSDPESTPNLYNSKSRMEAVHARIGYLPRPFPQTNIIP